LNRKFQVKENRKTIEIMGFVYCLEVCFWIRSQPHEVE